VGGYCNAQAIADCERDNVEVAAPIKRGAMNTEHFQPVQFVYDEPRIRCAARLARRSDLPANIPATEPSAIEPRPAKHVG